MKDSEFIIGKYTPTKFKDFNKLILTSTFHIICDDLINNK